MWMECGWMCGGIKQNKCSTTEVRVEIVLTEEIWQIAEGFVKVPTNLYAQLKKCGMNVSND